MKKLFLYLGLALFIGALVGCQGKEGKTGSTGPKGDTGETGATPEIWLYSELFIKNDADGGTDIWEFTLSSAVPFTTDSSRVMVSLGGFGPCYSDNQDRHLWSVSTLIWDWKVIGGNVIKVSGYQDFGDQSFNDAYDYWVLLNVIAFDQNYKVKGERKVTMPLKKIPAPMPVEEK